MSAALDVIEKRFKPRTAPDGRWWEFWRGNIHFVEGSEQVTRMLNTPFQGTMFNRYGLPKDAALAHFADRAATEPTSYSVLSRDVPPVLTQFSVNDPSTPLLTTRVKAWEGKMYPTVLEHEFLSGSNVVRVLTERPVQFDWKLGGKKLGERREQSWDWKPISSGPKLPDAARPCWLFYTPALQSHAFADVRSALPKVL